MANEFKLSITLSSTLGAKPSRAYSISTSPANSDSSLASQDATTSATAITLGPVATGRWLYIENTDATNFVNIGVDSSVATPIAKLRPLDFTIIPFAAATTYYKKADTATCKLVIFVIS